MLLMLFCNSGLSKALVPMRRMGTYSGLRRRQLWTCDAQRSNWMRRIQNCIPMRRMGTRWWRD